MAKDTEVVDIFSEILQEINEAGQTNILAGSVSSIKDLQAVLKEQDKLIAKTLKAGDERGAMRILRAAKQAQEAQVEATNNLRKAKEQLLKFEQEGNTKARDAQLREVSRINQEITKLAREAKLMQKNAAEFGKTMDYSMTQYEQLLQNREQKIQELGKAGALFQEKFANRFESSVETFTSGIGDLDSIGRTLKSSFESFGSYLHERAGKASEKAAQGKGSAGFAKMLGTFSKVAGTLAVVTGSLMAVVQLFNWADGAVKKLNQSILDSVSPIDLMHHSGKGLSESLADARDAFNDADFANEIGVLLDDLPQLIAGFEDLNMGLKYFGSFDKVKESLKQMTGFSKGLGISLDEGLGYMEKFAVEMGVSADHAGVIEKMEREFAAIRDMATQSTYSTKNFFNQVKDLTESLDGMNNRSREAGQLFLRFAKIVGPKGVGDMLTNLANGFKGADWLDLLKRQMLTKGKELGDILLVEARRTVKAFKETHMGGMFAAVEQGVAEGNEAATNLAVMFRKYGIDQQTSEEELVKILGDLDDGDRERFRGYLSQVKGAEGAGRALGDVIKAARGARKDASTQERSQAMERQGAGAGLATNFATIEGFLKGRSILDIQDPATLKALEAFGMTDQDKVQQFAELQDTMKGQMALAKELAESSKYLNTDTEEGAAEKARIDAKLAEMGLAMNEKGKLVQLDSPDVLVDSVADMMLAQSAAIEESYNQTLPHQITTEELLTQQVAETQTLADKINNKLGGYLQDIAGTLMSLLSIGLDEDDDAKALRKEANDRLTSEMDDIDAALTARMSQRGSFASATAAGEAKLRESEQFKTATPLKQKEMLEQYASTRRAEEERQQQEIEQLKSRKRLLQAAKEEMKNVTIDEWWFNFNSEDNRDINTLLDNARNAGARVRAEAGDTAAVNNAEAIKREAEQLQGTGYRSMAKLQQDFLTLSASKQDQIINALKEKGLTLGVMTDDGVVNRTGDEHIADMRAGGVQADRVKKAGARAMGQSSDVAIYDAQGRILVGEGTGGGHAGDLLTKLHEQTKLGATAQATSNESLTKLVTNTNPKTPAEMDRDAVRQANAIAGVQEGITERGVLEALKKHKEEEKLSKLKEVAQALGVSQQGNISDIAKRVSSVSTYNDAQKSNLRRLALTNSLAGKIAGQMDDFWIDGKGNLWEISPQDFPTPLGGGALAMTKPGGPVAEYVNTAIRGLVGLGTPFPQGQGMVVNVTVNGAKSPEETGREVVRRIKESTELRTGGTR